MTNQEINEAVARKLGWGFEDNHWYPVHIPEKPAYRTKHLPTFCTSIAAAWEILEALPKWEIKRDGTTVIVYLWDKTTQDGFSQTEHFQGIAADTAPMAICLAFLKLSVDND